MKNEIAESFLEMHYHKEFVESFKQVYGANYFEFIKPSPNKESWLGFDQAWVRSKYQTEEFLEKLKDSIKNKTDINDEFYIGYFMQYKVVEIMSKKSKHCPDGFDTPYYRSPLSLETNSASNPPSLSQHHLLLSLADIENSFVYYICPMIFNYDSVYEEPDTDKLRIVPIEKSTISWRPNDYHFLCFKDMYDDNPVWKSEPISGTALSFDEFKNRDNQYHPKRLNSEEILKLINDVMETTKNYMRNQDINNKAELKVWNNPIPSSFTLLKYTK